MDTFSLSNTLNPREGGGADKPITQAEYAQTINSLTNALNQMQAQIQQLNQLVVQSHNINSSLIKNLQEGMLRTMPRAEIQIMVGLAEHCNLNCAGCDHFSPLAESQFADFDEMERDFTRIAELFNGKVRAISFQGGEPLLHPEVTKILIMTRQKFPNARLYIITNGIKLLNMPEEFWLTCRDNNIEITPTKYPLSLDYDRIEQIARNYNVKFAYINAGEVIKTLFKLPLDLNGRQDERTQFLSCHRANLCIYLQNSRIYTCTVAPTIRHFDKKFGTHFFNAEANSIDIYEAKSGQEILEFLAKPIPFCRYCKIQSTIYNIPWHQSKKTIDEWT